MRYPKVLLCALFLAMAVLAPAYAAQLGLPHLVMPAHHDVRANDVNLKRLGSVLWLAHERKRRGEAG